MISVKIDSPGVTVATARESLLLCWKRPLSVPDITLVSHAVLDAAGPERKKFHALVVACAAVNAMPDPDTRRAFEKTLKALDPLYSSAVIVLEHRGFLAASLRGMLTGFHLIVKPAYPLKVVATRDEAQQLFDARGKGAEARALLAITR